MSCQYSLVFLFLCGFAALTVSIKTCGNELLEGTSCTMELPTKNIGNSNEIKWVHLSSDAIILRKNGKIRTNTPGLTMEEDGSLKFESVSLKNTGKYRYTVFNAEGTHIDTGEKEINVYVLKTCGNELLEGTSCTIQLPTKYNEKSNEIKWIHLSIGALIHRKNGKFKKNTPGLTVEEDGSLTFESVSLNNTGKYICTVFSAEGTQIDAGEKEIKVYAKAPKPTVMLERDADGNGVLTCDTGDRTDLTVSWYKEDKIIQNEKKPKLLLTSAQVQENKPYSCSVSNPVSSEQSDSVTVSFLKTCGKELLEGTSCTIQLPTQNYEKPNEIIWTHLSSGDFILRNNGKIRTNTPGLTVEEDGSLTFHNVSLNNTGKYRYTVFNAEGTQIDAGEKEINVYEKTELKEF